MKGTRYGDPFRHGIANMDDGKATEDTLKNMFQENHMSKGLKNSENAELITKVGEYIKKHGLVRIRSLTTLSGLTVNHVTYLLTYRYRVYETDDGRWMGMLDEKGNPYPIHDEPKEISKFAAKKQLPYIIVSRDESGEHLFTSQREVALYYGKDWSSIRRKLNGLESRVLKGIEIQWLRKNQ